LRRGRVFGALVFEEVAKEEQLNDGRLFRGVGHLKLAVLQVVKVSRFDVDFQNVDSQNIGEKSINVHYGSAS
jgi:hypothetical protein